MTKYYNKNDLKKILQQGDIILVHSNHILSKLIRKVTQSYWNHAALFIAEDLLLESIGKGVVKTNLDHFVGKDIAIFRSKKEISRLTQALIALRGLQHVGKKYDFIALLQLAWYFISGRRGSANKIGTTNKFVCSEFVADAYKYAGLQICSYLPEQTSPGDIANSVILKRL